MSEDSFIGDMKKISTNKLLSTMIECNIITLEMINISISYFMYTTQIFL